MMKTSEQFLQHIVAQQKDAHRGAAMLAYADALREWGDQRQADGWTFLVQKKKQPAYSDQDQDFSWFEGGPGFPPGKPFVLEPIMFSRLASGVNSNCGWREYPTRLEAEIDAALAFTRNQK